MKCENQFLFFLKDIDSADLFLETNRAYPFYFRQLKTVEHKAIIRTVYKSVMHDDKCSEDQKCKVWKTLQNLKNLLVEIQSDGIPNTRKRSAENETREISPKKRFVSNQQTPTSSSCSLVPLPLCPISPIACPQNRQSQFHKNLPYPYNLSVKNSTVKSSNDQLLHSTPKKHN